MSTHPADQTDTANEPVEDEDGLTDTGVFHEKDDDAEGGE